MLDDNALTGPANPGLRGLGNSGCAARADGRPVQLRHLFPGPDGELVLPMLDAVRPAVGAPFEAVCLDRGRRTTRTLPWHRSAASDPAAREKKRSTNT